MVFFPPVSPPPKTLCAPSPHPYAPHAQPLAKKFSMNIIDIKDCFVFGRCLWIQFKNKMCMFPVVVRNLASFFFFLIDPQCSVRTSELQKLRTHFTVSVLTEFQQLQENCLPKKCNIYYVWVHILMQRENFSSPKCSDGFWCPPSPPCFMDNCVLSGWWRRWGIILSTRLHVQGYRKRWTGFETAIT